jgi:hypothetical protein
MATVTTDVKLYFNVDTNKVYVKDTTVWPTLNGTPLNQMLSLKGLGVLTSPSGGTVFSVLNPSAPLINLAASATTSAEYNAPTANGSIVVGTYTLAYQANGSASHSNVAIENISNLGYIEVDDDNVAAFLMQAGDTLTIASSPTSTNNGTWTVVSTQALNTFSRIYITGSNNLTNDTSGSGRLSYTVTRSYVTNITPAYTGCSKVSPKITFTSMPYTGNFGTLVVSDATDYTGVTLTNHTISVAFPDGLVPAPPTTPVVGTNVNSVTISQVATGTYTITLGGTLTVVSGTLGFVYTLAGIRVNGSIVNVFERVVVWNGSLCAISKCVSVVFEKHNRFVLQGQESPYTAAVADLSLAINRYLIAVQCGVQDDIDSSYQDILSILNTTGCDCDCGCNDGAPRWIDNSNQDGANLLTQIQDEIDALQSQVDGISTQVDTNTANIAAIQAATPLVYCADLQQLTASSTISVVRTQKNTLGLTPTFGVVSTGHFSLTGAAGIFPQAKTSVVFQPTICANSPVHVDTVVESAGNSISLYGYNGSGYGNGNVNGTITITVYP